MKRFFISACLFLVLIPISSNLSAEEAGFFGEDYDMNVFKPKKVEKINSEEERNPPKDQPEEKGKSPEARPQITSPILDKSFSQRYQVNWLGLIINLQDQNHFFTETQNFLDFAIKNDFDLGPIYAIGKDLNSREMNKVSNMINGRGGALIISEEPPVEYQIKKSPVWIIGTKDGQYLLEGVANFQRYFNSSGELLVKSES